MLIDEEDNILNIVVVRQLINQKHALECDCCNRWLLKEFVNSQYRYFSSEQWKGLRACFSGHKMKPLPVDSLIKSTLTIISHFYSKDANVNKSLRYVKSILDNDFTVQQFFCFTVVKHFLKLIIDCRLMLARTPVLDYTEPDYTCIIWFKLFKKMFPLTIASLELSLANRFLMLAQLIKKNSILIASI
jgi:hypothetical protein